MFPGVNFLEFFGASLAALVAILGAIGRYVPAKYRKRVYITAFSVWFLVIGLIAWPVLTTKSKTEKCSGYTGKLAYKDDMPGGYEYLTLSDSTTLDKGNIADLRENLLVTLLKKADLELQRLKLAPYATSLLPYFQQKSFINAKVVEEIHSLRYIYLKEWNDTPHCRYHLQISLAKDGDKISGVMRQVTDTPCIVQAMNALLSKTMQKEGTGELTLYDLFSAVCSHCPKDPRVMEWIQLCQQAGSDCSNVYFASGQYKLKLNTSVVLNVFCQCVQQLKRPINIELRGYTDSVRVLGISYSGGADTALKAGTLLPGDSVAGRIKRIKTNIALSFARAYSVYEVFNSRNDNNFKVSYTGYGPSTMQGPPSKQRSVTILLKF